jgi:hypothetical protein
LGPFFFSEKMLSLQKSTNWIPALLSQKKSTVINPKVLGASTKIDQTDIFTEASNDGPEIDASKPRLQLSDKPDRTDQIYDMISQAMAPHSALRILCDT